MKKLFMMLAVAGLAVFSVQAQADKAADPSVADKIWKSVKLYENKDNAVLQSVALTGRLQGDYYSFHSDDHGSVSDANWRRARFGAKVGLADGLLLHVEADLDPNNIDNRDFYKGLTDAYIAWTLSKEFTLKVGKQSAGFTLDGATSSKKLSTMERSAIGDNIWFSNEYFTGVSGSGSVDGWDYQLGVFSASGDDEFGKFDSGWFVLGSLGRDVSDSTEVRVDYVHNDPDYSGNVGTKKLTDVISLVSQSQFDQLGLGTDLSFAKGDDSAGQSDMIGLQLTPTWDFSDMWQGVFSYSMIHCTDGPGATLGRYPKKFLSDSKYEDIQNFYLGVNCFLYGHKLKWQAGVEYNLAQSDSSGNDYNGWGVSTGFRLSW